MVTFSASQREMIVQIARSLIAVETLSGAEEPASKIAANWLRQLGYDRVHTDDCGNVIGTLFAGSGPVRVFDSHLDTVAADRDAWTHDPFDPQVIGGRLYGRGSTDMKGAFAAAAAGLAFAKEDGLLNGTIHVTGSVGEEDIEGIGISRMIPRLLPDLVVICESTELKLNIAQRGRAEVLISLKGKSAHASRPYLGVNALRHAARLVRSLDNIKSPTDSELGDGILEPIEIVSSPFPNVSVVPWACRVKYDRRLLIDETAESVLHPIEDIIHRLSREDATFNATAAIEEGMFRCYTGIELHQQRFAPAWRMPRDDRWVLAAQHKLREAGQGGEFGHYGFCTNGSLTLGRLRIPTVGYGPGTEQMAHMNDEYVELDQLFRAAEGYYALGSVTLEG